MRKSKQHPEQHRAGESNVDSGGDGDNGDGDGRNDNTGRSSDDNAGVESNALNQQRRAKLAALRERGERGNAFPNDFRRDALAADLHRDFGGAEQQLEASLPRVKVAGRLMSRRIMGRAAFAHLQDMSGRIQLFAQRDRLPDGGYDEFKKYDIGDIIAAEGRLFHTRSGELSVRVEALRILAKSLRQLPEKYHGLTDPELKYRRRYVDLIMNDVSRETFKTRAAIIRHLREFMTARGFLEVETPMFHPIPGGALARPFATHHNALDMPLFLRVAPELYLKRLVVGGFERVFEINRNFRNEGVSTKHNPEFTMLEFYCAYADYRELMDLSETMLRELCVAVLGRAHVDYQGRRIDFGARFARMTMAEAILRHNPGLNDAQLNDRHALSKFAESRGVETPAGAGLGALQMALFEKTVEEKLTAPTFITAYPVEVSPLSRRNDDAPELSDRFELFIAGREIANGFSELNDPEDQAARFHAQRAQAAGGDAGVESHVAHDAGAGDTANSDAAFNVDADVEVDADADAMHFDADYIRALEYGLPPTAGEGIGIDRLVMLLTDSASIRDVLLFPLMRRESTS